MRPSYERGSARLNPTVAALLRRGFDSQLAKRLKAAGYTLGRLMQLTDAELASLDVPVRYIASIRAGGRTAIPYENLAQVLWANRSTCCVCRGAGLAIIVHHIHPWAKSYDHRVENLAVLCLDHHARAHTRGDLEQNLSAKRLRDSKDRWEQEVRGLDPATILAASRMDGHHWWWFNHGRLLEMADRLGIRLSTLALFPSARVRGLVDENGLPEGGRDDKAYRYQGGDGNYLYFYMRSVFAAVLSETAIYNISDDLDPGFLSLVIKPGDLLVVQGKHVFKTPNSTYRGPGQATQVRREANGVRVSFTLDRWDAVSTSAWASWLVGTGQAASVVGVVRTERIGRHLHLICTGLAVGGELHGLSTRSYVHGTWPVTEGDIDEDGWLEGFDEETEN